MSGGYRVRFLGYSDRLLGYSVRLLGYSVRLLGYFVRLVGISFPRNMLFIISELPAGSTVIPAGEGCQSVLEVIMEVWSV